MAVKKGALTLQFSSDATLSTTDQVVACEGALVRSNLDTTGKLCVVCNFADGAPISTLPLGSQTGSGLNLSPADARNLAEALVHAAEKAERGETDPQVEATWH